MFLQLQDAQGSNVDSSIPAAQACADISTPSNTVGVITSSSSSSSSSSFTQLSDLEDSAQAAKTSLSSMDDVPRLQESLSGLKLEKDSLLSNGDSSSQCAADTPPVTLVLSNGDASNTSVSSITGTTALTSSSRFPIHRKPKKYE